MILEFLKPGRGISSQNIWGLKGLAEYLPPPPPLPTVFMPVRQNAWAHSRPTRIPLVPLVALILVAGFYTGLLSSGFMIGRIFSSHFWGLVADRHGSRFVLLWGLVGTTVLSIAFGFSKTFEYALACR